MLKKKIGRTVRKTKRKISKEFYKSKAWIKLALLTKELYGRKCMKCNKTKGRHHSDHIIPRSLRPDLGLDIHNIQLLCKACNLAKGNTNSIDYRTSTHKEILNLYLISKITIEKQNT